MLTCDLCTMIYILQPVPWKVKLESSSLVETQIEIMHGGEIFVNFKFKLNQKSEYEFVPRDIKFDLNLNSNLYREIPRNFFLRVDFDQLTTTIFPIFRIPICRIPTGLLSLMVDGTGCISTGQSTH